MTRPCRCGQPATSSLYLNYRYPRDEYTPQAVDPWYLHGGWPMSTCGAPGCEAEEYAELLSTHPDADVRVDTDPGAGMFFVVDDEAP